MGDRLRIGVIGTGNMGKNHVRILASESHSFELVSIYDASRDRAEKLANTYSVKAVQSPEALLKEVDAVVIAAPSSLHKEIGLLAVKNRVHALIEKPLALTSKDAAELSDAFSRANLKLMVGHVERFNPTVSELYKILKGERLIAIEARRYSPYDGRITDASVVTDLMIHDIDIVCNLLHTCEIKGIYSLGSSVSSDRLDFVDCMIKFQDGVFANISSSCVTESKVREIVVHTRDSYIVADLLNRTLNILQSTNMIIENGESTSYRQESVSKKVFVPLVEPLRMEILSFFNCIMEDTEPVTNGKVATRAIKIAEEVEVCK